MKQGILICLIIFLSGRTYLFAQHCEYDHAALIGVRPTDSGGQVISGLRITLIDKNGKPVIVNRSIYQRNKYLRSETDTAEFWRNPALNPSQKSTPADKRQRHFMQAGNDYIFITTNLGRLEKGRFMLIEDTDGADNGGFFSTRIAFAQPDQVQGLCGYSDEKNFVESYRPVKVQMDTRRRNIDRKFKDGYRFELDHSPLVNCPECKGCYCKSMTVYDEVNTVIFEYIIHGVEGRLAANDSMQISDFNLDGKPDIRLYSRTSPDQEAFFLFDASKNTFKIQTAHYRDSILNNQRLIYVREPFRFILEKNTSGVNLPSEKGYYANKISVFRHNDGNLIFTMVAVGNRLKETEGCADSLQIADYNFDHYPDFRVCNNSVPGKHTYYIYHPVRKTFLMERTLSELYALTFDFNQRIVTGHSEQKTHPSYPWDSPYQYYREELRFEGKGLESFSLTTIPIGGATSFTSKGKYVGQKRFYEGDSIGILIQKKGFLNKTVGDFSFEVEFNPEDHIPSGVQGAYVKILNIYYKERNVGHYEFHGNYFKEVIHWLDSLEIADYNFDGYPDIRMYNSRMPKDTYVYLIFNPEPGKQVYYQDTYFSLLQEAEFYPQQKILKGKITDQEHITYFFLKNDTLSLTRKEITRNGAPYNEESIYRYGIKQTLRQGYGNLDPVPGKEFGDYNFDGHEDFRLQNKQNPYRWEVFLFNASELRFDKDTLLSKFDQFLYDPIEKKLEGSFRIKEDPTSWLTEYYRWSFEERKMILYQTQVCISKFPGGESHKCIVSKLVDGKWIETNTFMAE